MWISSEKESHFIVEYVIPIPCSQPVGIAIDDGGSAWVVATWTGHLVVFNRSQERFTDIIEIPNWKTKGSFGSMVWGMEFDRNGDLWFTDQINNAIWRYKKSEQIFEMYKIPTNGSYPSQVAFDSSGRVWFSEIFGKKLGVIDPAKTENNTSSGITEYELKGIEFETMGPVTVSKDNRSVWFTAVTFPEGGNIVKFDMNTLAFQVLELDEGAGVPVGIAEDNYGRLWINDHATNLFFMFDPLNREMVKYSTSLPTSRNNTTTLPYWNVFYNGKIWFNEHEGNAIVYFDVDNLTLIEFEIPSRSSLWGNTSNALKFSVDREGSIWFTEWTENKLGFLNSDLQDDIPLSISLSKDIVKLNKNNQRTEALEIAIYPKQGLVGSVKMTVAGSIASSGRLENMSAQFSEDSLEFSNVDGNTTTKSPHLVTLWLTPSEDLVPGNYTLTIGARNSGVTYSKIVGLQVY